MDIKEFIINQIESRPDIEGRYTQIKRIGPNAGNGNFSFVFTADDNLFKKRRVALKFFDPLSNSTYRRSCFDREAKILKDLKGQRNIVPLLQEKSDFSILLKSPDGAIDVPLPTSFYVAHLARMSLSQYIVNGKSDYLSNIILFREMCKAVQRIHAKNICHRDIKPDNFLIYGKRYACISDFGTARYLGEKAETLMKDYSDPPGDRRYTAPELLCLLHFSDTHNLCADIYSLGAILFELFTKTELWLTIYRNFEEIGELSSTFHVVQESSRLDLFDKFIEGFANSRSLPSIRAYDNSIPSAIAVEIDKLYSELACLNYKKRLTDFNRIFIRINICEKITRYHKKQMHK